MGWRKRPSPRYSVAEGVFWETDVPAPRPFPLRNRPVTNGDSIPTGANILGGTLLGRYPSQNFGYLLYRGSNPAAVMAWLFVQIIISALATSRGAMISRAADRRRQIRIKPRRNPPPGHVLGRGALTSFARQVLAYRPAHIQRRRWYCPRFSQVRLANSSSRSRNRRFLFARENAFAPS